MSFLDKYRIGETKYLVYYHKGEIKVQEGYTGSNNSFVLAHENRWMTTAPHEYMKITTNGRVLVRNKEDIPIAKQMIREYYAGKVDEVKDRAITALTNIKKIVEETT